jgi:hypothetical protein
MDSSPPQIQLFLTQNQNKTNKMSVRVLSILPCQHEHEHDRSVAYYQIWQPYVENVYTIFVDLDGKTHHLEKQDEEDKESGTDADTLDWLGQFTIPLKRHVSRPSTCKIPLEFRVRVAISTYVKQRDQFDTVNILQHLSTVCIFEGDAWGTTPTKRRAYHNPEMKWIHEQITHETFVFQALPSKRFSIAKPSSSFETRLRTFWDTELKRIFKGFNEKEIAFGQAHVGTVAPYAIVISGMPVIQAEQRSEDDYFSFYKGVSGQSYFRPRRNSMNSKEWIENTLACILFTRGSTLKAFMDTSDRFFLWERDENKLFEDPAFMEEMKHCLGDVVRLATIQAVTRVYVADFRYTHRGKRVPVDITTLKMKQRPVNGDCEDSTGASYLSFVGLLTDPLAREDRLGWAIRRFALLLGIPFGVSGYAADAMDHRPSSKPVLMIDDDMANGHYYGAVIPVEILHAHFFPNEKEDSFPWDTYLGLFQLGKQRKTTVSTALLQSRIRRWPSRIAVLESTEFTTPFYGHRKSSSSSSSSSPSVSLFAIHRAIENVLAKYGELPIQWRNYAVEFPLAFDRQKGSIAHAKVFRLYSAWIPLVYPSSYTATFHEQKQRNVCEFFRLQHSFLVSSSFDSGYGVQGIDFFATEKHQPRSSWVVKGCSALMTLEVYQTETDVLNEFDAPVVPAKAFYECGDDVYMKRWNLLTCDEILTKEMHSWRHALVEGNAPSADPNKRIFVFCYEVKPKETRKLMEEIQDMLGKLLFPGTSNNGEQIQVFAIPYGNGTAFVFSWS